MVESMVRVGGEIVYSATRLQSSSQAHPRGEHCRSQEKGISKHKNYKAQEALWHPFKVESFLTKI